MEFKKNKNSLYLPLEELKDLSKTQLDKPIYPYREIPLNLLYASLFKIQNKNGKTN